MKRFAMIAWVLLLLLGCTSLDNSLPEADSGVAPALSFSHKRGFYKDSFTLTIEGNLRSMTIHYTLDGSDPAFSQTVFKKTGRARINIDPYVATNRPLTPCVVLRAVGLVKGRVVTPVGTHTFLFQEETLALSPERKPPGPGWPAPRPFPGKPGRQTIDYGMEGGYSGYNNAYKDLLVPALGSIPSVSLVTDTGHLFDPARGIYVNAMKHGREWERPASLEILYPDDPLLDYQCDTGLRIRGGWSRHDDCPKHAFRLFFRKEYGPGKLKYNLFADEECLVRENGAFVFNACEPQNTVSTFDKIDLRTSQNYSWSYYGDNRNTMNRDVFSRDLQRDLGRPYTRSRYYHLYLNGAYWGLYQSQERPEASFAASYLGGKEKDWDVVKVDAAMGTIEATDGNLDAWREVYAACVTGFADDDPLQNENYYKLQGLNPDGVRDAGLKVLVDIENLIDYMLIIFYTGNHDAPVTKYGQNQRGNNFYTLYNRKDPQHGFIFLIHDAEHTLLADYAWPSVGLLENRVSLTGEGATNERGDWDIRYVMRVDSFLYFHPQWLHHRLAEHIDYRRRFTLRARQLLEDGGLLSPAACTIRFLRRAREIELAIIAESARWGNTRSPRTLTKSDWQAAVNRVVDGFFPYRTALVISQLMNAGLY